MSEQIVYRILDANLDRAREAIRTIEEWCRFGLEDRDLCDRCKQMRQELARWHREEFRRARNTPDDPATDLSHANEGKAIQYPSGSPCEYGAIARSFAGIGRIRQGH